MVRRYSFPFLVFGRGPTQSIKTLEKGSSMTGRGQKRRNRYCLVGLAHNLTGMTTAAVRNNILVHLRPVKMSGWSFGHSENSEDQHRHFMCQAQHFESRRQHNLSHNSPQLICRAIPRPPFSQQDSIPEKETFSYAFQVLRTSSCLSQRSNRGIIFLL